MKQGVAQGLSVAFVQEQQLISPETITSLHMSERDQVQHDCHSQHIYGSIPFNNPRNSTLT